MVIDLVKRVGMDRVETRLSRQNDAGWLAWDENG